MHTKPVLANEPYNGARSYSQLTLEMFETEPKSRTYHRLVFGRLQGQGPSAEQTEARLTSPGSCTLDIIFQLQSFCLRNLIRCNIVFSFPAYIGPSIEEFRFSGGRRRKLFVGMCGGGVQVWLGGSVLGWGEWLGCIEKDQKYVHIGFLLAASMTPWACALCDVHLP